MRGLMVVAALTGVGAMASPAHAQAFNGARQIARGDLASAEHDLVGQRALYPDQVDLLLNLAAVYARTGRDGEARRLYAQVQAQPDEEVVLHDRTVAWSHALATRAVAGMTTAVASR